MRGRVLFNGNMGDPGLLARRVAPFVHEAAPPGRAPRVDQRFARAAAIAASSALRSALTFCALGRSPTRAT